MAKTSLIISATGSGGKTVQKTVTVVNPNASNAKLTVLGQMLNSLTTNTYQTTNRIDKTNCDTETKTQRTMSYLAVASTQISLSNIAEPIEVPLNKVTSKTGGGGTFMCTYRDNDTATLGCRLPYLKNISSSDYAEVGNYQLQWNSPYASAGAVNAGIITVYLSDKATGSFTATLHVDEDNNYTALDVPLTFNIVDTSQGGE